DVVDGTGFDESQADAAVELGVAPAHGQAGGDDRPHRGAADEIDRDAGRVQGPDRADMGIGPGPAARQDQAHRLAGDAARQPVAVSFVQVTAVEQARGRYRV